MRSKILLLCLFGFALCAKAADEEGTPGMRVPFERGSQDAPVVSVYCQGGYDDLAACVWADGRAVWSEGWRRTGRPFYTGQVSSKRLKTFLAALHSEGFFPLKWDLLIVSDSLPIPLVIVNVFDGHQHLEYISPPVYYVVRGKAPKHVRNFNEAGAFLRHQIESLMPRPGQKLRSFKYEVRDYHPTKTRDSNFEVQLLSGTLQGSSLLGSPSSRQFPSFPRLADAYSLQHRHSHRLSLSRPQPAAPVIPPAGSTLPPSSTGIPAV